MFEPEKTALASDVYDCLTTDETAMLLDCRAHSEWEADGVPDLSAIGKSPVLIELVRSDGSLNQQFLSEAAEKLALDAPLFVICKSGVRSNKACEFLRKSGFEIVCNVTGGWESAPNGWKTAGLPWSI